ncbi:MAG: FMN-binding glutamate synthase family protein [Gammaproteobacteria bacterium]|nr:FMN-binding glutamate synthase family protein [Gammaproteobacteria bacterium]NIR85041.1 FMN-binding glutamate synthase family protein [Gammaproteobacteria bacterium]NIR88308.1 FMN-binding glutamate synthase family protein [Gammaproteobacteria bacterium]NIU06088.1 FMN-binding glutamate synthase family protein [Gammaproteobacteria bacterium]NIV73507.1 FMN-binding glutamate synthase family protein [Gammaproteobacteria bacterium]
MSMKQCLILGAVLANAAVAVAALWWGPILWLYLFVGPASVLMIHDLAQTRHSVLRNYPVIGHLRYQIEDLRHQFRQYLIESDADGLPFSHGQRAAVYQRSKDVSDVLPFGTIRDVYAEGYEWLEHAVVPRETLAEEPRVQVGNEQCARPYLASRFNISAMSYGSLSSNAILALNAGARRGGFAHDTGEGGISRYHLEPGGDLIWEIGTGYFGCRTRDGGFDPEQFAEKAGLEVVKMIELKLSQGAKPGGGGVLPGVKVSREIAEARGVPEGETVHSPPAHRTFSTPVEMMAFLARLRELSGGKPVGFKLCLGRRTDFMAMAKAMQESGVAPDFITVDGGEGGTGAAPLELSHAVGTPLVDGLVFVHNALVGAGLRARIRLIACGKIIDGFDMAAKIAAGADLCGSARGMMFALGCIQARRCHTNRCPVGVTTQDPWRVNGLVVSDKARRVANYHASTVQHFLKLLSAAGLEHPDELCPGLLFRRISPHEIRSHAELYPQCPPGALHEGRARSRYQGPWDAAQAARF